MAENRREVLNRVIVKSWTDENYLARLKQDPRAVLEDEGMVFGENQEVVVHFEGSDARHFVIPEKQEIDFGHEDILRLAAARMQVVTQSGVMT